ncbi:MAG: hypothetical protein IJ744_08175 [Lachnospiraceae bacterium]|nr:hypothetical protein [Lachnospiraceae bacterium]
MKRFIVATGSIFFFCEALAFIQTLLFCKSESRRKKPESKEDHPKRRKNKI